jgi:Zn-dependent protease with chaperone function
VRIDEVRRRNRRRAIALATVAALNYWLELGLIATWITWAVVEKAGGELAATAYVGIGAALGLVIVALYIRSRLSSLGTAVVKRFLAVPVDAESYPQVDNLLAELALAVGVAPVTGAVMTDPAPNALTVGTRAHEMTIIVTTGLLEQLTRDELQAVLAAQMCAIRRLDVLLDSVVSACAEGAISLHLNAREGWKDPRTWFYIAGTFPTMVVARGIRSYAHRRTDFGADEMAVQITRHPEALVGALTKLHDDPQVVVSRNRDLVDLWFEPLPHPDRRLDKYSGRSRSGMQGRIERLAPHIPRGDD